MASFNEDHKYKARNTQKFSKKFNGKSYNNRPVEYTDVFFIPKGIKRIVDGLFDKGLGSHEFLKQIKKEIRPKSSIWRSTVVYIVNEAACRDKLEIIELILDRSEDREKIVNAKCGPKEFTPIFKSAYKGSIRALKILLCAGSDVTIQNKMGETVMQALEQGNIDTNNRNPTFKIFTDERYAECRKFLNEWNPNKVRTLPPADFKAYIPPNRRNDKKSCDILEEKSLPLDMSTTEFLNNYRTSQDIVNFIQSKKDPNKTFVDIIIESAEKSEETYDDIMCNLENLPMDILIYFLNDETFHDYIIYDAPFAKKKFNELREKFSFKFID
jgi:hypothetical protein